MKKLLLLSLLPVLIIASCKKKDKNVSITVTASFPTITFNGSQFFSIPVGGLRPSFSIVNATAYDSFYKQSLSVVLIDSTINNLVPGLYTAQATARNQYGYVGTATYYVAVTNISGTLDLSGIWWPQAGVLNATRVQKLATGLFSISNVNGVPDTSTITTDYFAVTNDTTVVFSTFTGALSLATGDTTIIYPSGIATGPAIITYTKQ